MAKVSVIITAWNEERYIAECILSVINQTYKDLEIIVVNDGSSDGTLQVIEKLIDKNKQIPIKLLSQSNKGPGEARNLGLAHATGKYIKFVDGDDTMHPQALEIMVDMAETLKAPIVKTSHTVFNDTKSPKKSNSYNANNDKPGSVVYVNENKGWLILENVGIGSKLYREDTIMDLKFPTFHDRFIPEDLAITPFIMARANKIAICDTGLYNYRRHVGSLTNEKTRTIDTSYFLDSYLSIEYLRELFKKENMYEEYKDVLDAMERMYRLLDIGMVVLNKDLECTRLTIMRLLATMSKVRFNNKDLGFLKTNLAGLRQYLIVSALELGSDITNMFRIRNLDFESAHADAKVIMEFMAERKQRKL